MKSDRLFKVTAAAPSPCANHVEQCPAVTFSMLRQQEREEEAGYGAGEVCRDEDDYKGR